MFCVIPCPQERGSLFSGHQEYQRPSILAPERNLKLLRFQLHLENHEGCLGSGMFSWAGLNQVRSSLADSCSKRTWNRPSCTPTTRRGFPSESCFWCSESHCAVLSNEPVTVLDLLHTLPKTDKHQQLWVEVMIWLMVVNVVFLPVFVSLLFLLFMVFMPFLHLPNSTRLRLSNPCAAEVCNC
jgi:hypothetical protein